MTEGDWVALLIIAGATLGSVLVGMLHARLQRDHHNGGER